MKLLPHCLPAAATAVTLALLSVPALSSTATAAPAGERSNCLYAGRAAAPAGRIARDDLQQLVGGDAAPARRGPGSLLPRVGRREQRLLVGDHAGLPR